MLSFINWVLVVAMSVLIGVAVAKHLNVPMKVETVVEEGCEWLVFSRGWWIITVVHNPNCHFHTPPLGPVK